LGPELRRTRTESDGADAARTVKLLDEILTRRAHVREQRGALGEVVETIERQRHAGAARERQQMNDGARAAADRHQQRDRVVECVVGEDL
jgi:hypothetical protein